MRALRDYQVEADEALNDGHAGGLLRPAIVLATGLGKTDVIAKKAAERVRAGRRVLVLAHRFALLRQIAARSRMYLPDLGPSVAGIVAGDLDQRNRPIVAASRDTLRSKARRARFEPYGPGDLVIVDECFPAGTLVGDVPIESVRTGDYVDSWDEATARPVRRRVVATMNSRPSSLVKVSTDLGEVVCTPGHPFLTIRGWMPAGSLPHGAQVLSFTHDAATKASTLRALRGVPGAGSLGYARAAWSVVQERARLLSGRAPGRMGSPQRGREDGAHESGARLGQDDRAQPDAPAGVASEDVRHAARDRAQAATTRGQRQLDARGATSARGVPRVAYGGHLHDGDRRAPMALQAGHRAPDDEGLRRGRRRVALLALSARIRRSTGRATAVARVAGVQVLEPGRDGTYGGLCPGGVVYNLEVASTHTYRVGAAGLVVHNCHHAGAKSYVETMEWAGCYDESSGVSAFGVTATMYEEGRKHRPLADVWQKVVYERDIVWAMTHGPDPTDPLRTLPVGEGGAPHGWLVTPRALSVVVDHLDVSKAKRSGGDFSEADLGRMVAQDADQIADAWVEHAADRITVGFFPTKDSVLAQRAAFARRGVSCEVVLAETSEAERGDVAEGTGIYGRLARGETRVMIGLMVPTEGWDCPPVDCVLWARPTKIQGLAIQGWGRGLRPSPGKADCLLLDVVGATRAVSLVMPSDLLPGIEVGETRPQACARCGKFRRPADRFEPKCICPPIERDPLGGRKELIGPQVYEEVDLFGRTVGGGGGVLWLRTKGGIAFVPAKDRIGVLQQDADGTWRAGHVSKTGMDRGVRLATGVPLEDAKTVVQIWAASYTDATYWSSRAPWRRPGNPPSPEQVRAATAMGMVDAERHNRAAVSDFLSVKAASRRLDRRAR